MILDRLIHRYLSAHQIQLLPEDLEALRAELEVVQFPPGAVLFRQGDPGDSLYILMRGHLAVRVRNPEGGESVVDDLRPMANVGEMALITGQPRSATVQVLSTATLVRLSREGFDRLEQSHPAAVLGFAQSIVPRLQRLRLAEVLGSFFGELDAEAVGALQRELHWQHLQDGQVLFQQGDPGDAMYIVINGRLRVVTDHGRPSERLVGEASRGESLGEMAIITGQPRMATAYAVRDSDVVRLSKDDFERFAYRYPPILMRVTRLVIQRLQRGDAGLLAERTVAFAVVGLDPGVPLADFTRQLAGALAGLGPTRHLDAQRFDALYGKPGAAQLDENDPRDLAIVHWLAEQENQHAYLVYEAEAGWSNWTRRCVHQADRVILVGRPESPSSPDLAEQRLVETHPHLQRELVLLHPAGTERPRRTAAWLDARQVHGHHHLRLGHGGDLRRLARRLTGRVTGLVLSGGGARGYAHLGVLRALREMGVELDYIGGASMGALVGGGYAALDDLTAGMEFVRRYGSRRALFDYTLPLAAFTASNKLNGMLRVVFGDMDIEDTWLPFFCVSTNISRAEAVVHRRGPLWHAARSSLAVPGFFTPIYADGSVLVDGGVINNFPVDIMRAQCPVGRVIGVNVGSAYNPPSGLDAFGPSISGWQVLWSRLNPFGRPMRVPSLLDGLWSVTSVAGTARIQEQFRLADLIIRPAIDAYGLLDFDRSEEIIQTGYVAAQAALSGWSNAC